MIPLRDTIPARRTAWIVRALILLNIAGFFLEWRQREQLEAFLYRFGVVPALWSGTPWSDLLQWLRLALTLISSQFLHGGVLHLGGNMLYLWIFGDNVEDRVGHGRFLVLYLTCGVGAAVAQILMQPEATVPMIGASGAIAGVLGAYFLLFPLARIVTLIPIIFIWQTVELPAFLFLGFWFVLQWLQGMTTIGQMAHLGGVAWWAHVGGFVSGLALLVVFGVRRTRGSS